VLTFRVSCVIKFIWLVVSGPLTTALFHLKVLSGAVEEMTSVLFQSGLNYQRNNPLGAEIRGLRADVEDLRKLIEDINYRLDQAGVAKPAVAEEPVVSAPVPAPAPAASGGGRRRG
jgi:hypothetical protein